jgi:REP element-mobilizing transposase RayT
MRKARHKSKNDTFYHIFTRVAGSPTYFPLHNREASRKLIEIIRFYIRAYCCQLVSFEIMGNHYHFIAFFAKFCRLTREELRRRAHLMYGERAVSKTANWSDQDWEKFNCKLFDVSALMQHINGRFATWFNRRFNRRGHFWGDRFKNTELLDKKAIQECLYYIELNAVRAGIVDRPEKWDAGSTSLRWKAEDQDLMPLAQIFSDVDPPDAFETYRSRLYHRGGIPKRQAFAVVPQRIFLNEVAGESRQHGLYMGRLRFFVEGLAIGSHRLEVGKLLEGLRAKEYFRRRKNPIPQLNGFLYTIREQRSSASNRLGRPDPLP